MKGHIKDIDYGFTSIPPISYKLEPGDGTGSSIQDRMVRNKSGLCATLGCENKIEATTTDWGVACKMCEGCEKKHLLFIEQMKEILYRGMRADDWRVDDWPVILTEEL